MQTLGKITLTDPLANAMDIAVRDLFMRITQVAANGTWTPEQVSHAALNLLCNALRQGFDRRQDVERQYDELVGKLKTVLLDHYDRNTGLRRSVFAWDQGVQVPLLRADDKF